MIIQSISDTGNKNGLAAARLGLAPGRPEAGAAGQSRPGTYNSEDSDWNATLPRPDSHTEP